MISIRQSRPDDGERIVAIWAAAVDATHHFLKPDDRAALGEEVASFLPRVPLLLATTGDDQSVAFMLLDEDNLEALFVDPHFHGRGIGKALVLHALAKRPGLCVDVNAQNSGALGFYRHLGFAETGHSDVDGQGRAYPLIHMRHEGSTD